MIKITNGYEPSVTLSSLHVGDTFLIEERVCMIALRNGHSFVLDLSTGKNYCSINPSNSARLVVPIECELSYKIKYRGD